MTAPETEPLTAEQARSEQIGKASPLVEGPGPGDGDSGGSGGIPPRWPPPTDRDRHGDGRPARPPRWQRMLLWGVLIMLSLLVSFGIGRLGVLIERGMSRQTGGS